MLKVLRDQLVVQDGLLRFNGDLFTGVVGNPADHGLLTLRVVEAGAEVGLWEATPYPGDQTRIVRDTDLDERLSAQLFHEDVPFSGCGASIVRGVIRSLFAVENGFETGVAVSWHRDGSPASTTSVVQPGPGVSMTITRRWAPQPANAPESVVVPHAIGVSVSEGERASWMQVGRGDDGAITSLEYRGAAHFALLELAGGHPDLEWYPSSAGSFRQMGFSSTLNLQANESELREVIAAAGGLSALAPVADLTVATFGLTSETVEELLALPSLRIVALRERGSSDAEERDVHGLALGLLERRPDVRVSLDGEPVTLS